jgi:hypothetical protein
MEKPEFYVWFLGKTNGTRYGLVIQYIRNIKQIWHICLVRSLISIKEVPEVFLEIYLKGSHKLFLMGIR